MSNVDAALAALGGATDEKVSADPLDADVPTAQVPADVLLLARMAANAKDRLDEAKEILESAGDELKAAMDHHGITAVQLDDRDITISTAKRGSPQKSKKAITAVMEDMAEKSLRANVEDPNADEVVRAREAGAKKAGELWKGLPLSVPKPRLTIPKPTQPEEPE